MLDQPGVPASMVQSTMVEHTDWEEFFRVGLSLQSTLLLSRDPPLQIF
jgi:hypothetical protein